MSWIQKFAAEPQQDGSYVIAVFQPAQNDPGATGTCIKYTGGGAGCTAAQTVQRFVCTTAEAQWING